MGDKKEAFLRAFQSYAEGNEEVQEYLEQVLTTLFLGYKYRKKINKLYTEDSVTANSLITYYYSLNLGEVSFDRMKKAFVTNYCTNESKIEGVNDDNHHGALEVKGLKEMYEYLHSPDIDEIIYTEKLGWWNKKNLVLPGSFDASRGYESSKMRDLYFATTGTEFALTELNQRLFSFTENNEQAGYARTQQAFLSGDDGNIELCDWTEIGSQLKYLDIEVQRLLQEGERIKPAHDPEELLKYLDDCVVLNCKLMKVHPFGDGNGRTIRAFTNKLLETAGLPPIYIKSNEREEYHKAMRAALGDEDYSLIKGFYRYKICDSIIELDINDRVNHQHKTAVSSESGGKGMK